MAPRLLVRAGGEIGSRLAAERQAKGSGRAAVGGRQQAGAGSRSSAGSRLPIVGVGWVAVAGLRSHVVPSWSPRFFFPRVVS